jgi:septal ring factor EnvC (AmiA/AmiB activator)
MLSSLQQNTSQDYDDLNASYLALQKEFHQLQHAYADLQEDYEANKVDISDFENLKVQFAEQKSTFETWKLEFEAQMKEQYENAMVFTTAQNTPKAVADLTVDFALEEDNNKVDIAAEYEALKVQFSEQKSNFEAWKVEFENQKSDFETLKSEYDAALDENQNLGKYLEDALLER